MNVAQDIINALSLGGLFALAALGIALIFGVMRLINFAHGELIMAGGYSLWLFQALPWPLMLALTALIVGALAILMERAAFRLVRGAPAATLLVTSFFVSSLFQNTAIISFGSRSRQAAIFPELLDNISVGGMNIVIVDLVTLVTSLAILAGMALLLTRTLIGLQIRAASENFTTARLLGVRGNRVIPVAFLISGFLGGIAAIFLIARTGSVHPQVGLFPAVIGFIALFGIAVRNGILLVIATVVGGMGSLVGAVAAAFLLGGLTVGLQSGLPLGVAEYRDAFVFGAVMLLLIWRPQGLLPTKLEGDRV